MPTAQRRRRVAWGTLTRKQVIDAAEERVRDGTFATLSMRSLASDLGVTPMALYRHVSGKDDLLDEVVDRLLASRWKPRVGRDKWTAWIHEAAKRLRDLLITEPAALHAYLSHPVVSPNAIARMDAMLEVLGSAGFRGEEAERAYAAIHTYTIGFAVLEASRAKSLRPVEADDPLRERLARFTTAEQFNDGLTCLLEGLETHRG